MRRESFVLGRPIIRLFSFLSLTCALAGCYDHHWTQAIMERNRRMTAAQGAKIAPKTAGGARPQRFAGRVRFLVAADYRAKHPRWQGELRSLLDEASAVTRASFGITLEEAGMVAWEPQCDATAMDACLEALARVDRGDDDTWVVGVLGAVPRYLTRLDDLGRAGLLGRHFVVRDPWEEGEREAVDQAFAGWGREKRDEVYAHRKRHRRLAIFLHEWGHTLGAVHANEGDDLLHPQYDDRMQSFGGLAHGIIEASLIDRFGGDASHAKLRAYLAAVRPGDIAPSDRAMLDRLLEQPSAPPPAAAPGPTAASQPTAPSAQPAGSGKHPMELPGDDAALLRLSGAERERYQLATEYVREGDLGGAYRKLAPLTEAQPDCLAVQHLGCGLAMQLGDMAGAQTLCARVQKLSAARRSASAAR